MTYRSIPEYPRSNQPPKIIICPDGTEILVDAEDYPLVSRHSWVINRSGCRPYAFAWINTTRAKGAQGRIFMHHMILGTFRMVDHIDTNTLNNQKHNFRVTDCRTNGWNRAGGKGTKYEQRGFRYKGVYKYKNSKGEDRWRVNVLLTKKGEKAKYLHKSGFMTDKEAAIFYNQEIVKVRGEWAWLNPIEDENATEAKHG